MSPSSADMILVIDSVRSIYNVGSLLRSAEAFGISKIIMCGPTAYPRQSGDKRLPHVIEKAEKGLAKTALGAEKQLAITWLSTPEAVIKRLNKDGFKLICIENVNATGPLEDFKPLADARLALVVGHEKKGVNKLFIDKSEAVLSISTFGPRNSLNVAVAGAIAMHSLANIINKT